LILWQRVPFLIYSLEGVYGFLVRVFFFLPFAGFLWSSRHLDVLDPLGMRTVWLSFRGRAAGRQRLVTRGPYRWVRHPMYTGVLVLIWACPVLTADRLFFNLLWSGWVIAGARMEEWNLVAAYGDAYRSYQKKVPMLIPSPKRRRS
jgi:protein-S-isoprenylcysteine O-methyltransferase Ste14